jgi:serine/threonine protein kinase
MGTVWRAHDELLRRDVAVKEVLLPPGLPARERELLCERTLREARAAAALNHPAVVRVYDVVTDADRPWIVMELLEARSISEVLRDDGPLPVRKVAEMGLAVLGALEAAHRVGVLHRDVKPGNVLLGADGRTTLTDFGVARSANESPLTSTGLLLGSPQYIAPERARGQAFGPSSDLWSLGATLYTAVEGRAPFDRGDPLPTMTAVVCEPPDPVSFAGPLAPVLDGLLEKDPDQRWDAAKTRSALKSVLAGVTAVDSGQTTRTSVITPPPQQRPKRADSRRAAAKTARSSRALEGTAAMEPLPETGAHSSPAASVSPAAPGSVSGPVSPGSVSGPVSPGSVSGPVSPAAAGSVSPAGPGPVSPAGRNTPYAGRPAAPPRAGRHHAGPEATQVAGPPLTGGPPPPRPAGPGATSVLPPGGGAHHRGPAPDPQQTARYSAPQPVSGGGGTPRRAVYLQSPEAMRASAKGETSGIPNPGRVVNPAGRRKLMLVAAGIAIVLLIGVGAYALSAMLGGPKEKDTFNNGTATKPVSNVQLVDHQDERGFSVKVPSGWEEQSGRSFTQFNGPGDRAVRLLVERAASPEAAVRSAKNRQANIADNFQSINDGPSPRKLGGADTWQWEWTWNDDGQQRRVLWRTTVVDGRSYTVYVSAPNQNFSPNRTLLDQITESFQFSS